MKRSNAKRQSRAETFDNRPKWLSELGRQELENLVCETTLGGCGHTFASHGSTELSDGRSVVFCITCNAQADKYVDERNRELSRKNLRLGAADVLRIRKANSCHEFVSGVVTHVDFEKLFRDLERGVGRWGKETKSRVSKDERKAAKASALALLGQSRKPQADIDAEVAAQIDIEGRSNDPS